MGGSLNNNMQGGFTGSLRGTRNSGTGMPQAEPRGLEQAYLNNLACAGEDNIAPAAMAAT